MEKSWAANEDQGQISPEGHWVAYTSNESGRSEICVIRFLPASNGGKWQVSRGGGVQPGWSRNGKELFYIFSDSRMMAVDVHVYPTFQSGTPHALFQTGHAGREAKLNSNVPSRSTRTTGLHSCGTDKFSDRRPVGTELGDAQARHTGGTAFIPNPHLGGFEP
jgi:hypothetical protein